MIHDLYVPATSFDDVSATDTEITPTFNNYVYVVSRDEYRYEFNLELAQDMILSFDKDELHEFVQNKKFLKSHTSKPHRVYTDENKAKSYTLDIGIFQTTHPIMTVLGDIHNTKHVFQTSQIMNEDAFVPTATYVVYVYSYEKLELHGSLLTLSNSMRY